MVKQKLMVLLVFLVTLSSSFAENKFHHYFEEKTLRFDFNIGGNAMSTTIFPVQLKLEPFWAGPLSVVSLSSDYGTLRYSLFEPEGENPIYRSGFTSLFQEWQHTPEASIGNRYFYQSLHMPFPRYPLRLVIEERTTEGQFNPIYTTIIDPEDYFIVREQASVPDITWLHKGGKSSETVDLVFLAEGYTLEERLKFIDDAQSMTDYLFSVDPFSQNLENFNVGALFAASPESGTDIPHRGIYANTRFGSTFSTFDMDRYLTVSNMRAVYDVLSGIEWDTFFVLVNSDEYGGGGFYNFMGVGTARHPLSKKVFIHELGHSFAGLADEYYTSHVAFEFPLQPGVEPWEPNITTLVDFDRKWSAMLNPTTPVPTPRIPEFEGIVGVFEGGGYREQGVFSPVMDCRMKSNAAFGFCPVCQRAIQQMIDSYR